MVTLLKILLGLSLLANAVLFGIVLWQHEQLAVEIPALQQTAAGIIKQLDKMHTQCNSSMTDKLLADLVEDQ